MADEIARILALPFGDKPVRSVVDLRDSGVEEVNEIARRTRKGFVTRMGFGNCFAPGGSRRPTARGL
ncbi:hypothetical protein ABZ801_40990 [Actinomadura sp. NPDC047616]|uniref:hypothetical protein n=1 Tax=Actinomadura sp. NPDC047616 TaxID=3155914 RepID=UPI0033F159A7